MSKENLILAELNENDFTAVPNYFLDNFSTEISPAEFVIVICLLRHAQYESLNAKFIVKISLIEIAEYTGLTKKTIVTNLEKLLQKQYIFRIKHVVSNNRHQTNKYILNTEKLFGVQDE
jgi:DNA-binding MarR family transcriptional regulator